MGECEYLVSYGTAGAFGRFRQNASTRFARGDRVVVRTHRGLEAGEVLREAAPGHARFLPNTTVGQLLRAYGTADARTSATLHERGVAVRGRASELIEELLLPLELLDVDVLLDGEHVVLNHLCGTACDVRPLVSAIATEFGLQVWLEDLAGAVSAADDEPSHDCGSGCGSCGSEGGCGDCGSGCGTCSSHETPSAHFAALRAQMEERRTSLL
jgi:hypothetical protein